MQRFRDRFLGTLAFFGFSPVSFMRAILGLPQFVRDAIRYRELGGGNNFPLNWMNIYPALGETTDEAGTARGHYFHQDLWAARKVFELRPPEHVDIGSRLDGFIAHILTFMPVKVIDIRPLRSTVVGLSFEQANAINLIGIPDDSIESLSSLHAIEHFGLGRYGDPVNPQAPFQAMTSMSRVLAPGGRLYLSVPIGIERVEFNAHRIFSPITIVRSLPDLDLVEFSAVNDAGQLVEKCAPSDFVNATYACGLFEFTKKSIPPTMTQ